MSLTELLLATQDPRKNAAAEAQIKQAESANVEQYFTALAQELANAEKPVVARQLAGLLLKNGLAAKDLTRDRELKQRWVALPANSRNLVKEATTTALVFPQVDVGKAAVPWISVMQQSEVEHVKAKLDFGRALQAENQSLREKLARLGHSPADLQGWLAEGKLQGNGKTLPAKLTSQSIQKARDLLASRYDAELTVTTSGTESRLTNLLRKKLELQKCQEDVKSLEIEGASLRQQVLEASNAIRAADTEALNWRQARREILQGCEVPALKAAQASLLQKREQLRLLRLEARRSELSPAVQKLKALLGSDDGLMRDVLHRWCHVAIWSSKRHPHLSAGHAQEADSMEAAPLVSLELVAESFAGEGSFEVSLVARVGQEVHRTEARRLRGKVSWLENRFTFEASPWSSTLELEVLSVGSGDPETLGFTTVDFLSLTPGKWHLLKERLWGSNPGRLELWVFVTMRSSTSEVVEADAMPKPTQRELQKMQLQEVVKEEALEDRSPTLPAASKDGKSQRELQRKELERLLESPNNEKQKEAKMKSLETKIAEMQAELEAMKSEGTTARQKRDQKRLERHGNATGMEKFRSVGKRLAGSKDIEVEEAAAFGFRFEDLFKLGQEVIDEGTSEEYNIYGDSDTEEKFLQRQAEAQKIIAQERERMEGGVFGRMRKGVTAGGARERAARRKGKRGEAKDASPAPSSSAKAAEKKVENTSVSPRRTPTEAAPSLFGFNFELPELLAFGQEDDAASEEHNIYGSDTEEMQTQRREEAKEIMSQEKERLEGMGRGRLRQGLVTTGGARERMAKKKGKKLGAATAIAQAVHDAQASAN